MKVVSDWRKKQARPTEHELDTDMVDAYQQLASQMGDELDRALDATRLHELLLKLKPDYRDALYLYYFHEKKYDEIADILRRPTGSVATLIHRAKKECKTLALQSGAFDTYHD